MNTEIKAKWCAALRSGDYTQGKGRLHNAAGEFCCLGVLTDLWAREVGETWSLEGDTYRIKKEGGLLSDEVTRWAGISTEDTFTANPGVKTAANVRRTLSELNDSNISFQEIATLIEEQL